MPTFTFVTYQEFNRLSYQLAQQINSSSESHDMLVSISRGGALVSRIVCDLVGLQKIYNIGLSSYHAPGKHSEIHVYQPLGVDVDQKRILLLDEVCDSGATFEYAVDYLQRLGATSVTSACLHLKPKSTFTPNYFVEKTEDWVVYPYEYAESAKDILEMGGEEMKTILSDYARQVGAES